MRSPSCRRRELVQPIKDAIAAGKPFLGICLGLQLLFDVGYEGGEFEGLGVLRGKVVRFDLPPPSSKCRTWAGTAARSSAGRRCWKGSPTARSSISSTRITSCRMMPELVAIEADYGHPFCAAVWRDNLFATQFHPEKSQADGLRMLKNFAEL